MKKLILLISLCLSYILCTAQIPQPDPDTTARHFLIVASIGNLQEVNAGRLAEKTGKNAAVRSFGEMMIKGHGEAEQKLLQLARSKGITLPSTATGGIQADLNLKNAGENFDKLYVHAMINGHRATVHTFENYATTGKDPNVRAFAKQMLPIIKQHLAEISAIEAQLK